MQVERHTTVLMRPNALIPFFPFFTEGPNIRVLDNLELVLLVLTLVKVLVESVGGKLDCLSDQAGEVDGDLAHLVHVLCKNLAEFGQHFCGRPLVGRQQVVVQRRPRGR